MYLPRTGDGVRDLLLPGTSLRVSQQSCPFNGPPPTDRYYSYPHFTNEEPKAEKLSNLPKIKQMLLNLDILAQILILRSLCKVSYSRLNETPREDISAYTAGEALGSLHQTS